MMGYWKCSGQAHQKAASGVLHLGLRLKLCFARSQLDLSS
jgi:hypothetical protein